MVSDPIADMLTRIRNAHRAGHEMVDVPLSALLVQIGRILRDEGYVGGYETVVGADGHRLIQLTLKYGADRSTTISGVRRISKPGKRVYVKRDKLPKVLGGLGIAILSTSRGLMTDRQARRIGVGGEVLAYVW